MTLVGGEPFILFNEEPSQFAKDFQFIRFLSPSRSKLVEEVIRAARELLTEALACSHFEDEHSNEHVVVNLEKSVDALDASLDSGGETDDVVSAKGSDGGSPE